MWFSQVIEGPKRSIRARKEKHLRDSFFLLFGRTNSKESEIFSINLDDDHKTFNATMSSRDTPLWKEVVNYEMDSIMSNKT